MSDWFEPFRRPSRLARSMRREGLTYLSRRKLVRMERALSGVAGANIPGDYLEFGVALGGSAVLIATHAARSGACFQGFDVFDMIPEPTSDKDDPKSKERYEIIAAGKSKGIAGGTYYGYVDDLYSTVSATMAKYGVPLADGRVTLHKGLFEETVPRVRIDRIAFAHVDCDWFDPVTYCLDFIAPRLSRGGKILVDDYHSYGGARTATDEFLQRNPGLVLRDGENPIIEWA